MENNQHEESFKKAWQKMFYAEEHSDKSFADGLKESAMQIHMLYESFVENGFSEKEALYLVGSLLGGAAHK